MQIIVNGKPRNLDSAESIESLLLALSVPKDHVAVEHNGTIVEKSAFASARLAPNDRVEIIHFVGGG